MAYWLTVIAINPDAWPSGHTVSALPKVSAAVARRALDAALLAAEPAETVTELMRQIATAQIVVATRYHSVPFALL